MAQENTVVVTKVVLPPRSDRSGDAHFQPPISPEPRGWYGLPWDSDGVDNAVRRSSRDNGDKVRQ